MLPYGVEDALGGDDDDGKGAGPSGRRAPPPPPPPPGDGDDATRPSPLARASLFLRVVASDPGRFDAHATPGLKAVAFSIHPNSNNPTLRCELPFSRAITNRYGGLHGGAAATLVDVASSAALAAISDRPGVSLSITTHYHRPVVPLGVAEGSGGEGGEGGDGDGGGDGGGGGGGKDGAGGSARQPATVVVVDSEVVKVGKHVAAVEVAIRTRRREEDEGRGPVLVSGTHVKALVARSDLGPLFEAAAAAAAAAAPRGGLRSRL